MNASARPYAEALFALASDRGQAAAVCAELAALDAGIPDAARVLLSRPGVRPAAAAALLDTIAGRSTPLVGNFLRVLSEKRRLGILPDVVAALQASVDAAEGRVRAIVQAARPLSAPQAAALAAALGRRLGREVDLSAEVRPDLIGGARVVVGDRVLDGSLSGQLVSLRRWLRAARA